MDSQKFLLLGLGILLVVIFLMIARKVRRTAHQGEDGTSYRDHYVTDSIDPDGAPTNLKGEPFRSSNARQKPYIPARERPVSQGGDIGFNRAQTNNTLSLDGNDNDGIIEKKSSEDSP